MLFDILLHIWQVPSPLSALSVTSCSVPQHTGSPTSSLTSKSCRRTLTGRPRRERSNESPTNRETCPIFHCRNQYSSLIQVKVLIQACTSACVFIQLVVNSALFCFVEVLLSIIFLHWLKALFLECSCTTCWSKCKGLWQGHSLN